MIAGGMSKSGKIGMVGGYPIPEVNRLMNAFMAGAREINPKAEFMVTFINSWFDPPKAKEAAFAMIDKGADVMYAERFGVSDAAKERKVLAIGNVIDTQAQYPDTVVARRCGTWSRPSTARIEGRQGRQVQGRGLRPVLDDEAQGLRAGAAGHASRPRCRPTLVAKVRGASRRRSSPASSPSRSTTPAQAERPSKRADG